MKKLTILAFVLLLGCKCEAQSTYDGPEMQRLKSDTAYARKYHEGWEKFIRENMVSAPARDSLYYYWLGPDSIIFINRAIRDTFLINNPERKYHKP